MGDENLSPTTNRGQLTVRDEDNDERYALFDLVDNVESVKDQLSRYYTFGKPVYPILPFLNLVNPFVLPFHFPPSYCWNQTVDGIIDGQCCSTPIDRQKEHCGCGKAELVDSFSRHTRRWQR